MAPTAQLPPSTHDVWTRWTRPFQSLLISTCRLVTKAQPKWPKRLVDEQSGYLR